MTPQERQTLHRLEGLCTECEQILAANPGHLPSLRRMGYAQWILGNYTGVEETATEILRQNPSDANWLYSRSMARMAMGRLYEAEDDLICARGVTTDERMQAVIAEALSSLEKLKDQGGLASGS